MFFAARNREKNH